MEKNQWGQRALSQATAQGHGIVNVQQGYLAHKKTLTLQDPLRTLETGYGRVLGGCVFL